jgi:glyoxylase-like metal-dependent hydrolase (beta-lactamase superfamily II)
MTEIKRIKCGNGNCYIVANAKEAILVDAAKKEHWDAILDACRPYEMKLLLLTHGHFDHTENAAALSGKLGIPIAMHKADLDLIDDNMAQSLTAGSFFGKIVLKASQEAFSNREMPKFQPTIFLDHGDDLSEYGVPAKVIGLPGHTNGSIAIDVDGKYLIAGDAVMNMLYPTVSLLYHNREEMLDSAAKISALGERIIYFGHGKPARNRLWVH